MMRVDLICMGGARPPEWPMGKVTHLRHTAPESLERAVKKIERSADALLFWDPAIGVPDVKLVASILHRPQDVWHAGLRLGMAGHPGLIDFVQPTWMLNCDPAADIQASSWRLSLRACLVRMDVVAQLGGPRGEFDTLAGASLELGHRYITRGALMRHLPELAASEESADLSIADELRFIRLRFGSKWTAWALARAIMSGYAAPTELLRAWKSGTVERSAPEPPPLRNQPASVTGRMPSRSVSVLIPTLDRYPYLRVLLSQLGEQTVPPEEIIVVDQTPAERRQATLEGEFPQLPLRVRYLDHPGQCSSRNRGIRCARGDAILLLDDDDEISADLIERHLDTLERFEADVSCGVAEEEGAGPIPEAFRLLRTSDVMPANNAMIRRSALERTGLFDLAYDTEQRSDKDLGMRLYLSGSQMVLNPSVQVYHHHAPRGGLREHGARIVTYASSRQRIMHRHLPSVSELYLAQRYFSDRCRRETIWLRLFGTLIGRGGGTRRALKALVGIVLLPYGLQTIRKRNRKAAERMNDYPDIPNLTPISRIATESAIG